MPSIPVPDHPEQDDDEQAELRRRFKAALALKGLTVPELAKRLPGRGYGEKTLYNMQSAASDRDILPRDYKIIADALRIDPTFFTADFGRMGPASDWPDPAAVYEAIGLAKRHDGDIKTLSDEVTRLAEQLDALRQSLRTANGHGILRAADDLETD